MNWFKRAWSWFIGDWRRWAILPAVLGAGLWLVRRASLLLRPRRSTDPSVHAMTPAEGDREREAADVAADNAIRDIRDQAARDKERGRELYGGDS